MAIVDYQREVPRVGGYEELTHLENGERGEWKRVTGKTEDEQGAVDKTRLARQDDRLKRSAGQEDSKDRGFMELIEDLQDRVRKLEAKGE